MWVDGSYGLIKWKMEMNLHRSYQVDFGNPDFVAVRRELRGPGLFHPGGGRTAARTLRRALAEDTVSVIACPVDYSENTKLTEKLEN